MKSRVEQGSTFEVVIKEGIKHFDTNADIVVDDASTPVVQTVIDSIANEEKPLLLVIEDNEELRHFIVKVLGEKYRVMEAENGQQGYEVTCRYVPDFVVTDIMMPVMDGVEYVRQVRANSQISHVPIILLTAKTDMQSKLECLKLGANDYITKPFSMVYLQTRIENIIEDRKKWQDEYRRQLLGEKVVEKNTTEDKNDIQLEKEPVDEKDAYFMKKLVEYIEANIENSDLSPEDIANGLKISRWNLTSKVKSIVGLPPVEFLREMRLNKAAQLIRKGELNMTQITYSIGMTDSRYFSRVFKAKYDMTPTEYKAKYGRK